MILVTGATGFIGRHVVRDLAAKGLPIRCLIPEHVQPIAEWQEYDTLLEVMVGNLFDEEVLFQAMTGIHSIIHLRSAQWWGNERNLERIELAGTRNLISAARSARVGRIVYLSHLGAAPSSAHLLHRIKGQTEEIIRNSGLAFTVVRSGFAFGEEDHFVNNFARSFAINPLIFLMAGEGDVVLHPIHIEDLSRCITASLEELNVVDNTIEIGGIEYITLEDMILTIMRVTGMYRLIIPIPLYLMRLITQLNRVLWRRTLVTPQWVDMFSSNRTTQLGNVYEYFQFQPRRFEDTLLTYMPQRNYFLEALRFIFKRRPRSV